MGGEPSKILHDSLRRDHDGDQTRSRPSLLHGGANVLQDAEFFASNGVTCALSICQARPPASMGLQSIKHVNESDLPQTNLLPYFEEFVNFIHAARVNGGCVYVHCAAGVSRSTTALCSYLICVHGLTFKDALDFIRTRREVACPNPGFVRQLQFFEQDANTVTLRARIRSAFPDDSALVEGDLNEIKDALAERRNRLGRGERLLSSDPRHRLLNYLQQRREEATQGISGMEDGDDDHEPSRVSVVAEAPCETSVAPGEEDWGLTWVAEERDEQPRAKKPSR